MLPTLTAARMRHVWIAPLTRRIISVRFGHTVAIRTPKGGGSVQEGVLVAWHVPIEAYVVKNHTLLAQYEVLDKIVLDISAPASGYVVQQLASPDDTIPTDTVIGAIDEDESDHGDNDHTFIS